jgi:hypothetical protein
LSDEAPKTDAWFVVAASDGGRWDDPDARRVFSGPYPRAQADEWLRKTKERFIGVSSGLMHEDEATALRKSPDHHIRTVRGPN